MDQMSSSVLLDHNYHEIEPEFSLLDEDLLPVVNDEDIADQEMNELVQWVDNNSALDQMDLQLMGFADEDIDRLFDIIGNLQINGQISGDYCTSGNPSVNHSLNHSSSALATISGENSSKKSNRKRKSSKKSDLKPGKQLRYLLESLGIPKTPKNKNVSDKQLLTELKSRIITRSQTNSTPKQRKRFDDNKSEKANNCRTNGKTKDNRKKSDHKLRTTITKCMPETQEFTLKAENLINKVFVRNLCKHLEDMKQNGQKEVTNKLFRPFLPLIKLEKLEVSNIPPKEPKNLEPNSNSLLQKPITDNNRQLRKTRSTPHSCVKRTDRRLRNSVLRNTVVYKGSPLDRRDCLICKNARYRSYTKLMSTYLKNAFPKKKNALHKTKKPLKSPIRVKVSKNWSPGVTLRFSSCIICD